MGKSALIFGAGGQDGHYLGRLLLSKGYTVLGCGQGDAAPGFDYRLCDISDMAQVSEIVSEHAPMEAYNLAGISSPRLCEENPQLAHAVNVQGVANVISALQKSAPSCRLFHASTAYIFAEGEKPKDESSPIGPRGIYGKTKLEAQLRVQKAREDGLHAASGILFNHESPLRPAHFVTRKITQAAARFKLGKRAEPLPLGNLDAVRDWGFAGDYVEAMQLMLQSARPKDYVVATGVGHSVRELCEEAFSHAGLDYRKCISPEKEADVRGSPDVLVGNPSFIRKDLNWSAKTSFKELVGMMVEADLKEGN